MSKLKEEELLEYLEIWKEALEARNYGGVDRGEGVRIKQ